MTKDDHLYHLEEDFYSQDRKTHRKERKLASSRDRSKYKKSDQDQLKKQTADLPYDPSVDRSRVLAVLPEGIVICHLGEEILCSLKGSLKQERTRTKNLIAVGDFVRFEHRGNQEGIITHIEPRHSTLSRAD
ncbi:MAG: ribosome small subunit-dependent GTPase, partial [Chlamydiales bacterium]|nr:ribosome small subunit-dependent GTPase [Chlamydiales bacterium]